MICSELSIDIQGDWLNHMGMTELNTPKAGGSEHDHCI